MVLAILLMAAAAAGGDEGIVANGSIVVGSSVVSGILAWLTAKRGWAEKEKKLRAEIANELRTKIVNDPLNIEQTPYQASMKANAAEHREIFDRLRKCEANVATLMERSISQGKILDRMADQVGQLYDRIVMGKRK